MKNVAETLTPVGNRLLVEVVRTLDEKAAKSSGIILPSALRYPQIECEVVHVSKHLVDTQLGYLWVKPILISNLAGIPITCETTGKEYRLITPNDILLILE